MDDLTKHRLAISEARFDDYHFGWEIEEVHHWHLEGDLLSRTVLFCGEAPGSPCIRGYFLVRFLAGRPIVDECHATIDGCLIGHDPRLTQDMRKAS